MLRARKIVPQGTLGRVVSSCLMVPSALMPRICASSARLTRGCSSGRVLVDPHEHDPPHQAERSRNEEHGTPAPGEHDQPGHQRRAGNGEAAEKMRGALDPAALAAREPHLHAAAGDWKCAGFTEPEKNPRKQQRAESDGSARHGDGGRDRQDHDGKHALRPETIAEPTNRNLRGSVCPGEGSKHPTHIGLAEPERSPDLRLHHGGYTAIDIRDQVQEAEKSEDPPAKSTCSNPGPGDLTCSSRAAGF